MCSPDVWGRPPSRHSLLLVLQGLTAQVQAGMQPDALPGAVDAAQRLVLDIVAEGEALSGGSSAATAKWPTLDGEMAATALQLLLACHSAAEAEQQAAERSGTRGLLVLNSADAAAAVQQAGQGILRSLCAWQEALPPALCDYLVDAFTVCPALEDWTVANFGLEALDGICADPGAPPLLLQLQPAGEEREGVVGLRASSPCLEPEATVYTLIAASACAEQKQCVNGWVGSPLPASRSCGGGGANADCYLPLAGGRGGCAVASGANGRFVGGRGALSRACKHCKCFENAVSHASRYRLSTPKLPVLSCQWLHVRYMPPTKPLPGPLTDARRVKDPPQLRRHLKDYGWVLDVSSSGQHVCQAGVVWILDNDSCTHGRPMRSTSGPTNRSHRTASGGALKKRDGTQ